MKKVALYLRLSKEDMDKPTKEGMSESIKNQELMLKEEVEKHPDWEIIDIYCDEDFSGAGSYRPQFERMIKQCEKGDIDIVLSKSQSRFSRDMEIIEKYLHNKFIEWNIRFISLIDNADTKNVGNKKSRQINALVNEWFLEDLSDNIKSTFRSKWKSGECTSAFAKYGLMKDPKNKNHLIIDPIASEVLKKIATMFLNGYGQEKIASTLERLEIPSPYEYKLMNGCKLKLPIPKNFDPLSITTSGKYIIKLSLYNNYQTILNNICSIFYLGTNKEINQSTKFSFKLCTISQNIKLFYTTESLKSDEKNKNFENEFWKPFSVNEEVKNITFIGSKLLELDRLNEISFELEIELPKNKFHNVYQVFQKTGSSLFFQIEIRKKYKWNGQVIYKMLRDETYHGNLVQGKTKRISYKNHKCIKSSEDEWIKSENALEKIFDDETWMAIQHKMNENHRSSLNGKRDIFTGKLYCDVCGSILHKNSSYSQTKGKKEYFICKDRKNKWSNCDNKNSISREILNNYIIQALNQMLKKWYDISILNQLYLEKNQNDLFLDEKNTLIMEKNDILSQIEKNENVFSQLYFDRANRIIDESDYFSLHTKYEEKISKLRSRLNIILKEIKYIETKTQREEDQQNILKKYDKIDTLTLEIIENFIDQVKIGKINPLDSSREIKIVWAF